VHWAKSDLLVLYSHEEKRPPNFSPNSPLELLFAKKLRTNRSKNTSSLAHQASNNKKQNCCASDRPWQRSFWPNTTTNQQYHSTSRSIKIIANSLCNFLSIDCCLVASFLNLVKTPHHAHVDHGNCDFEMVLQAIQLILVKQIKQVEYKPNSDELLDFFYLFFSH
jgi:hypothetical protein